MPKRPATTDPLVDDCPGGEHQPHYRDVPEVDKDGNYKASTTIVVCGKCGCPL